MSNSSIRRTGKLIMYPKSLLTTQPQFNIVIHPVSKIIYKIDQNRTETGNIILIPISGSGASKIVDPITTYNVPYIMTLDNNDLLPIDHEWQKVFNINEVNKIYDVDCRNILTIGDVAFRAEQSRLYSINMENQTVKLTKSQLEQLNKILGTSNFTIKRIKR